MVNYKQLRQNYRVIRQNMSGNIRESAFFVALIGAILAVLLMPWHGCAFGGQAVDMAIIAQIESSNNPMAYNEASGAVGLCQITRPALREYNAKWGTDWKMSDLFNPDLNMMVGEWYMNQRIPEMLKYYKIPDTLENRLKAYNWGIGNMRSGKPLPQETRDYIKKYKRAGGIK